MTPVNNMLAVSMPLLTAGVRSERRLDLSYLDWGQAGAQAIFGYLAPLVLPLREPASPAFY